jgi:hypothetical protein
MNYTPTFLIYLQFECSVDMCPGIIYSSVKKTVETSFETLKSAVARFLTSGDNDKSAESIWRLSYKLRAPSSSKAFHADEGGAELLPSPPFSIAMEDEILENVKAIWSQALGDESGDKTFLRFEEREQDQD